MSYSSIYTSVYDSALRNRVTAACAQEGEASPDLALNSVIWPLCSASDIEAAYESALAGNNPNPGGDPAVITDAMILAKVQAFLPQPE